MDRNGIITHYTVRITDTHTGRYWTFVALDDHISVASLVPHSSYDCAVSAFTVASGPYSNIVTVKTNQAGIYMYELQLEILYSFLSIFW